MLPPEQTCFEVKWPYRKITWDVLMRFSNLGLNLWGKPLDNEILENVRPLFQNFENVVTTL